MIIRLYILLVSYFLLTWLSGYFGRKVINKLDLIILDKVDNDNIFAFVLLACICYQFLLQGSYLNRILMFL